MGSGGCGAGGRDYPSDCQVTQGLRERSEARRPAGQRSYAWRANLERAAGIRLLLLDVDGVLTDSTIVYLPDGVETKGFSTRDGLGIRLLQEAGVEVGIITARRSEVVQRRAANLGISRLYQGAGAKREVYEQIIAELDLMPEQVAYMGDDWLDLPVMTRVGLAAAVADAAPEVRDIAHYVTASPGGRGAVREVCDLLIEAQGRHAELLKRYLDNDES
ncbi:MAG: HAD hydrolase family protein [Desulfobulbales bacterium]|nr:HAD hydrolase family protein [Desulfobulbales bacterium]